MNDRNARYWDHRILSWERSVYDRSAEGLVWLERVATRFRAPVRARMDEAVRVLAPWVPGKSIVDVGCGSGIFAQRLLALGASKVIGLDMAPAAILAARKRFAADGTGPARVEFLEQDLADDPRVPAADLTVGLGFLDYLVAARVVELFRHLRSPHYFFSFPERRLTLRFVLHEAYLRAAGCPVFVKHTRRAFDELLKASGRYEGRRYETIAGLSAVHNLPF